MKPIDLNQIVEALVFASGRVVSAEEIRDCVVEALREGGDDSLTGPGDDEISASVDALNSEYESTRRSFRIHRWAGGYRMATTPDVAQFVQRLFSEPPRKLTRSLMETLSIVAYRQPIIKPEIDTIRGVDSSYGLRRLMELGFVAMVGRSDTVGRPLLFGTTTRFLEEFGLLSLDELPKLREAEELFQDDQLMALRDDYHANATEEEANPPAKSVEGEPDEVNREAEQDQRSGHRGR